MITLENREKKLVCYEIPTTVDGGQTHHIGRVHRSSDAQNRVAGKDLLLVVRNLPTTLTLTARGTKGCTSNPLSDAHADIPAIAKAIAEGKLVKSVIVADAKSAPAAKETSNLKRPAAAGDGK